MAMNRPGIKAEPMPMGMAQAGGLAKGDPRLQLPTFIYDYFLKTRRPDLAQAMLNKPNFVNTKERTKASPSGRDLNGINDGMPKDEIQEQVEKLPLPDMGESLPNDSFLQDWFCTFWDIWSASRQQPTNKAAEQYVQASTTRLFRSLPGTSWLTICTAHEKSRHDDESHGRWPNDAQWYEYNAVAGHDEQYVSAA